MSIKTDRVKTRLLPVIMLAVLSPFTAEFLLGDQYLSGLEPAGQQITSFILYVAFYGMAAVLIRELARRLRIGWAGLMLLALGFGIFEEGLVTQSLFNPHYLGFSLIERGYIPGLGIAAPWTVFVLSLHVVWSISSPIAIVEAWYGRGAADPGTAPWLGRAGMIICLVILVLAAAATAAFSIFSDPHQFVAPPARLIAAAVAAALAVLFAVRLRDRQRPSAPATIRATLVSALLVILAAGGFEIIDNLGSISALESISAWISTVIMLAIWAAMVLIMVGWSRRASALPAGGPVPFGLAAGAVITYCWVGLRSSVAGGFGGLGEQLVLVIIALAVIVWTGFRLFPAAVRRPRQERSPALP